MKGKINKNGVLFLGRPSKMKPMECRFAVDSTDPGNSPVENEIKYYAYKFCQDDCPHFGEPIVTGSDIVELSICQGKKLLFKDFVDEREQ